MAAAQTPSLLERGIFDEVERLRTDPPARANLLKAEPPWSPGLAPAMPDRDLPPTLAVSLPRVEFSASLSRAAAHHVRDTGNRGLTGHRGSDGSGLSQRIERYGSWSGRIAENIIYGPSDPRAGVFEQLLDFGIWIAAIAGHFQTRCGAILGFPADHASYRVMCVRDFASAYRERADFQSIGASDLLKPTLNELNSLAASGHPAAGKRLRVKLSYRAAASSGGLKSCPTNKK